MQKNSLARLEYMTKIKVSWYSRLKARPQRDLGIMKPHQPANNTQFFRVSIYLFLLQNGFAEFKASPQSLRSANGLHSGAQDSSRTSINGIKSTKLILLLSHCRSEGPNTVYDLLFDSILRNLSVIASDTSFLTGLSEVLYLVNDHCI